MDKKENGVTKTIRIWSETKDKIEKLSKITKRNQIAVMDIAIDEYLKKIEMDKSRQNYDFLKVDLKQER